MTLRRAIVLLLVAGLGVGIGTGYAATLSVSSWHVWSGSQALTKGTCTLTGSSATADTDVSQSSPNSTDGGANTMVAKQASGSSDKWAFVSFDLSSCSLPTTGGADSATLSLVIKSAPASNRTLTVTPVLGSWSQSTLTWNTAQTLSYGGATTTFATGTTNNVTVSIPVTIDVDALIKNPSASYGWRITDLGSGTATTSLATVDAASNHPQLVINYEK